MAFESIIVKDHHWEFCETRHPFFEGQSSSSIPAYIKTLNTTPKLFWVKMLTAKQVIHCEGLHFYIWIVSYNSWYRKSMAYIVMFICGPTRGELASTSKKSVTMNYGWHWTWGITIAFTYQRSRWSMQLIAILSKRYFENNPSLGSIDLEEGPDSQWTGMIPVEG